MDRIIQKNKYLKFKNIIITAVSVIITGIIISLFFIKSDKTDNNNFELFMVKTGNFDQTIKINAVFEPDSVINVYSGINGIVKNIFIENGTVAAQDQLLIEIEDRDIVNQLNLKNVALIRQKNSIVIENINIEIGKTVLDDSIKEMEYELKQKEMNYKVKSQLPDSSSSPNDLIRLKDEYLYYQNKYNNAVKRSKLSEHLNKLKIDAAWQECDLIQQEIDELNKTLILSKIKSPVTGIVTDFNIHVGEFINTNQNILKLNNVNNIKMISKIDEFYLNKVFIGKTGIIEFENKNFQVVVNKIYSKITEGKFEVVLVFKDVIPAAIKKNMNIGQNVIVTISLLKKENTLLLKKGAYINTTGGNWVYVYDRNTHTAVKTPISTGIEDDNYIEVLNGLNAGDEVIVSSYDSYLKKNKIQID